MTRRLIRRWRERRSRSVTLRLPFDDIMEFALALLSLAPAELEMLGWTFSDRKRLLDHFLTSGASAKHQDADKLAKTIFEFRVPARDVERLRRFAHRELPKAASNAAMLDRVATALDEATAPQQ